METVKEKLVDKAKLIDDIDRQLYGMAIIPKRKVLEIIEQQPTIAADTNAGDKWVSVEERLPEESLNSVIGWDEYRKRCVFVQYYKGEWILGNRESVKILAWMPLPEPPKEVQ